MNLIPAFTPEWYAFVGLSSTIALTSIGIIYELYTIIRDWRDNHDH